MANQWVIIRTGQALGVKSNNSGPISNQRFSHQRPWKTILWPNKPTTSTITNLWQPWSGALECLLCFVWSCGFIVSGHELINSLPASKSVAVFVDLFFLSIKLFCPRSQFNSAVRKLNNDDSINVYRSSCLPCEHTECELHMTLAY